MTRDLWPTEDGWPSEQLAAVFNTGGSTGKGATRMIEQEPGEDRTAFLARFVVERATAPEVLWVCMVDETEGRWL